MNLSHVKRGFLHFLCVMLFQEKYKIRSPYDDEMIVHCRCDEHDEHAQQWFSKKASSREKVKTNAKQTCITALRHDIFKEAAKV
jgi:hypothetical protein